MYGSLNRIRHTKCFLSICAKKRNIATAVVDLDFNNGDIITSALYCLDY